MILPSLADQLAETLRDASRHGFRMDENRIDALVQALLPLLTQREAAIREEAAQAYRTTIDSSVLRITKLERRITDERQFTAETIARTNKQHEALQADRSRLRAGNETLKTYARDLINHPHESAIEFAEAVLDHLASLETPAQEPENIPGGGENAQMSEPVAETPAQESR